MKTILFVRHAKSSWANIGEADFDRPLNQRGKKDAPAMAKKLFNKGVQIDQFVTSTALRAASTCMAFAKQYNMEDKIMYVDKLYHAEIPSFFEVIQDLNDILNSVAIFSHNPGISEMVSMHTNPLVYTDMPTCGVYAIQANVNSWKDFELAEKQKLFFTYPKDED